MKDDRYKEIMKKCPGVKNPQKLKLLLDLKFHFLIKSSKIMTLIRIFSKIKSL